MNKKVSWGVLGVANIAMKKVLPAMQRGEWCDVSAIASRDLKRAQEAAKQLGIAKAFGSYEELLADPEIEAVYNPLPNHLHVPWSIKAAEAGKHVLCEKPISMTSKDIDNRKWTGKERRSLRKIAKQQAAGDDCGIDYGDIPRMTAEQLASMVRARDVRPKIAISVRLDPRVLDWLKSKGEGHLTRINDILTNLMEMEAQQHR